MQKLAIQLALVDGPLDSSLRWNDKKRGWNDKNEDGMTDEGVYLFCFCLSFQRRLESRKGIFYCNVLMRLPCRPLKYP